MYFCLANHYVTDLHKPVLNPTPKLEPRGTRALASFSPRPKFDHVGLRARAEACSTRSPRLK